MTYQLVSEQEENLRIDSSVYCQRGTAAAPTLDGLVLGEYFYLSAKINTKKKSYSYFSLQVNMNSFSVTNTNE